MLFGSEDTVTKDDYLFLVIFGVVAFGVIVAGLAIRNSQKKEEEERQRLTRNTRKRWAAAKNIRKINWRDQFVIDDGEIDEDHNHLLKLINEFNAGIITFIKPEQLVPVQTSFTEYTETHFKREEELQKETKFPFCAEHKEEHKALIETFNGLKLKASKANEDNVTDVAVEIGKFLQDWLTKHVIESDLPLKAYLKRNAEEAKETDDLAEQSQPAPH